MSVNQHRMNQSSQRKGAIARQFCLHFAQQACVTLCLLLLCWLNIGLPSGLSNIGHVLSAHHFAYAEELPELDDIVPAPPSFNTADIQVDDISSEKISQFVRAYVQVVELIDQREVELQQAETELESLRIQHDIVAEAFSKIEATGLSQQEYLQLLGLANIDPEFGDRIATQLEEIRP